MIVVDCIFRNNQKAPNALALMRSRYSAYATHNADYLLETTHVSERPYYSKGEILKWATANRWEKLEILSFTENTVGLKLIFWIQMENPKRIMNFQLLNLKIMPGIMLTESLNN
jgi:SEC-C motif-containing protein